MSKKSQWTIDTLKEWIDDKFINEQNARKLALEATDKAIIKSEITTEKRFDSVNEFRSQLRDQASTFITRHEFDSVIESIKKLELFQAQIQGSNAQGNSGRAQNNWIIALVITILMFIITMGVQIIRH